MNLFDQTCFYPQGFHPTTSLMNQTIDGSDTGCVTSVAPGKKITAALGNYKFFDPNKHLTLKVICFFPFISQH